MMLDVLTQHRRVLLLQGPVGPFFRRLAQYLSGGGARPFKINFNGGDAAFFPGTESDGVFSYRNTLYGWRSYLHSFLITHDIDAIVLFGDCRPYHRIAAKLSRRLGLPVYVFEEGYLRPDFITLERDGVNANSLLPRSAGFYAALADAEPFEARPVGNMFWAMGLWGFTYSLAGMVMAWRYPYYRHHKDYFTLGQWGGWLRAGLRKALFWLREGDIERRLRTELVGRYFVVALQLYNDAQLTCHSNYSCVDDFIAEVIESFAVAASADRYLVIKHHPMDRGFRDYAGLIVELARQFGVEGRIFYVHDLHLPALLRNAAGTVVVNSTVGLSSLYHGVPVKVLGRAFYDIAGLTHQGPLAQFWSRPAPIDAALYGRFRQHLIRQTQINGSFYFLTRRGFGASLLFPEGTTVHGPMQVERHSAQVIPIESRRKNLHKR